MTSPFDQTDVTRIAKLARIALTSTEIDATTEQLGRIFALIETMQAVDTTGIEPLTTPLAALGAFPLRLRDDVVTDENRREAFQQPAPSVEDGLYLVPKVIE